MTSADQMSAEMLTVVQRRAAELRGRAFAELAALPERDIGRYGR